MLTKQLQRKSRNKVSRVKLTDLLEPKDQDICTLEREALAKLTGVNSFSSFIIVSIDLNYFMKEKDICIFFFLLHSTTHSIHTYYLSILNKNGKLLQILFICCTLTNKLDLIIKPDF